MQAHPSKRDFQEMIELSLQSAWRVGIVYSSFYEEPMQKLVDGAVETLKEYGLTDSISLHPAAGSFEVPLIGAALAHAKQVDALIGLGIIIEGETEHARLLADSATKGLMDVQLQYRIPFAFELLYVDSLELANRRLEKGKEAALSVLYSLAQLKGLQS